MEATLPCTCSSEKAVSLTWALVSPQDNAILAVGLTFSLKLAEDMPESGGGLAGAIASLRFPALVQATTFFTHLEIQPEPDGHVSPPGSNGTVYAVPHFGFHSDSIPEEEVWSIPVHPAGTEHLVRLRAEIAPFHRAPAASGPGRG
jgi:hypothetical protein